MAGSKIGTGKSAPIAQKRDLDVMLNSSIDQYEHAEEQWKRADDARKKWRNYADKMATETIPGLMHEAGVDMYVLRDGRFLTLGDELHVSIDTKDREQALTWLDENKCQAIVRRRLSIDYGDLSGDAVQAFLASLKDAFPSREITVSIAGPDDVELGQAVLQLMVERFPNYEVKEDRTVHGASLRALVKKRLKMALNIPMDLFGVYWPRKVVINPAPAGTPHKDDAVPLVKAPEGGTEYDA